MILGCPECHTRFAIDAQALRPDGRRVKCGKCDHIWFEEPPPPSSAEPLSVPPLEPDELSSIPTPNLPAITRADQRRTAGAAWVLVCFLLVVVGALAWFGRGSIAQAWPAAEQTDPRPFFREPGSDRGFLRRLSYLAPFQGFSAA